jgi:hypothetical protein
MIMFLLTDSAFCYLSVTLQLCGIASVAAARLWETTPFAMLWRTLCLLLLCSVGLVATASIAWECGGWQTCGVTMAVMAVGATLDMRGSRHAEAF